MNILDIIKNKKLPEDGKIYINKTKTGIVILPLLIIFIMLDLDSAIERTVYLVVIIIGVPIGFGGIFGLPLLGIWVVWKRYRKKKYWMDEPDYEWENRKETKLPLKRAIKRFLTDIHLYLLIMIKIFFGWSFTKWGTYDYAFLLGVISLIFAGIISLSLPEKSKSIRYIKETSLNNAL